MQRTSTMFLRATAARQVPQRIVEKVLAKSTVFNVSPHGLLQLRVLDCSPKFIPLDYAKYPGADCVVVSHCAGCDVEQHRMDFVPTKGLDPKVLSISCTNTAHAEYCGCCIQVPNHLALDISANGDADIKIADLEPSECHISSEYSSVHLHKIKTKKASIFANNGSVQITGHLTGNINIKTGVAGFVRADRLQGSVIKIDTFEGPITCNAIYGEEVQLSSREGNILTKNLQGNTKIWSTAGDVEIGSLEGTLSASLGRGNLSVNVAATDKLQIESQEGNVSIGLNESIKAMVEMESSTSINTGAVPVQLHNCATDPSKTLLSGTVNGGSETSTINIITKKGQLRLHQTSWMDSLKLGQNKPSSSAE